MTRPTFKQNFIKCIKSYIDKNYIKKFKDTNTPKISIYYLIGYLSIVLGKKQKESLLKYLEEKGY